MYSTSNPSSAIIKENSIYCLSFNKIITVTIFSTELDLVLLLLISYYWALTLIVVVVVEFLLLDYWVYLLNSFVAKQVNEFDYIKYKDRINVYICMLTEVIQARFQYILISVYNV